MEGATVTTLDEAWGESAGYQGLLTSLAGFRDSSFIGRNALSRNG